MLENVGTENDCQRIKQVTQMGEAGMNYSTFCVWGGSGSEWLIRALQKNGYCVGQRPDVPWLPAFNVPKTNPQFREFQQIVSNYDEMPTRESAEELETLRRYSHVGQSLDSCPNTESKMSYF